MSKKGKSPSLSKMPSIKSTASNQPSTSHAEPKELYSYTPNWITPQEKAKLKARVHQIKMKENRLTLKEDVLLLQQADTRASQDSSASYHTAETGEETADTSDKNKVKKSKSSEGVDKDKDLKKAKSDKSVKSDKSASGKGSKESVDKTKSKESVKSNKSGKSDASDKSKSKEDLRMAKQNEGKTKHPKEAHANPSGNTMEAQPQREISTSDLNEHLWASNIAQFDPQIYHFKSPEKLSTKNPVLAECPPFWVLLDHTVAVTWKLFNAGADRKDLGIIPLQWSREFVSAMRDERGEYLPATGQLLSAIEDALIDRYAKASDANECEHADKDGQEQGPCKKTKGDCNKDQDSLSYVSSESIFKYPVEVSYTLKDIMSRNMPGRMRADGDDAVKSKDDSAAGKADVPPPEDHETMTKTEMLDYLKQLKLEQDLRVEKEKEHAGKIEALMELLAKGKISNDPFEGYDSKKKKDHEADHVHFDEEDEDQKKSGKGDKKKEPAGKGGKEKEPAGKGGKEKGKGKEGQKEVKIEISEDDQKKKKKVSMEEDKGSKKKQSQ